MADRYISEQVQRCFRIVWALENRILEGASPSDLSAALGIEKSMMTRDLANLKEAGVVEVIDPTGRYRLSSRIGQLGVSVLREFDTAEQRLAEMKARYIR
jgi:DNA-binding IclR family transcriptional regulator